MELIKMVEIGQFRNVIKDIDYINRFAGVDDLGEPIFKEQSPPVLTFTGTVKLHGTNGAVSYDGLNIWAQSKNNIITPEKDNAGFAQFVHSNMNYFENLLKSIYKGYPITLFGEWAGKGVRPKVAISEIQKSFFIFGLKVHDIGWVPLDFDIEYHPNIFKITDFKTYDIEIDFSNPKLSQNKIIEMVAEVETECPVAKRFGFSGVGEGIVFKTEFKDKTFIFKAKGEKHANKCKVKTLPKVDDVKLQIIQDVSEKVTPAWRLEQMWSETFDIINGGSPDIKKLGDFLRAVSNDIIKEDMDILKENGLSMKDVGGTVSKMAKTWFFERLDS